MLFYIVRHGAPDYKKDMLLDWGWEQAEDAARYLEKIKPDALYTSPMDRAQETASCTARRLHMSVQVEPWAYELQRDCHGLYPDGTTGIITKMPVEALVKPEYEHMNCDEVLDAVPGFSEGFKKRYYMISEGLDDLLERNGYKRLPEGYYQPVAPNDKKIVLFCHGGMTRVMLSHLFHIPYNLIGNVFIPYFNNFTVVYFRGSGDAPVGPKLFQFGDIGHLCGGERKLFEHFDGVEF